MFGALVVELCQPVAPVVISEFGFENLPRVLVRTAAVVVPVYHAAISSLVSFVMLKSLYSRAKTTSSMASLCNCM